MKLDSYDRIWLRGLTECAIRAIVEACGNDGLVAAHNFRIYYREYQRRAIAETGAEQKEREETKTGGTEERQ